MLKWLGKEVLFFQNFTHFIHMQEFVQLSGADDPVVVIGTRVRNLWEHGRSRSTGFWGFDLPINPLTGHPILCVNGRVAVFFECGAKCDFFGVYRICFFSWVSILNLSGTVRSVLRGLSQPKVAVPIPPTFTGKIFNANTTWSQLKRWAGWSDNFTIDHFPKSAP